MYTQNIEGCYREKRDKAILSTYLSATALEDFRKDFENHKLPALSLVEQDKDIDSFKKAARQFSNFEDILILGTGGSSLGGQTLCALSTQDKTRFHFLDNIDPTTFSSLLKRLNLKKTGVLAISKSGTTVETLFQLLTCLQHFENQNPEQHFIIITEPKDNTLRKLANTQNWTCLDHPLDVGGRYSCFSVVGLFPAILAGLDVEAFRKGGQAVLKQHLTYEDPPALWGAALGVYLATHHQKTLSVIFPYADQLKFFSFWYRQLWAESLGKDEKGTTPIQALGTVDQHSQLQLYLDGPKDKFFTLIMPLWKGQGERITLSLLPEAQGKSMGDLFEAEAKATYQTLLHHKCPTRLLTLTDLDEYNLGALMMHFMIETILTASLIGVNAFDQPAVEHGKRLARDYLKA